MACTSINIVRFDRRPAPAVSASGLPSDFARKGLLLLRSGYVGELASASYPHIYCGGSDIPCIAGGVCGDRRQESPGSPLAVKRGVRPGSTSRTVEYYSGSTVSTVPSTTMPELRAQAEVGRAGAPSPDGLGRSATLARWRATSTASRGGKFLESRVCWL